MRKLQGESQGLCPVGSFAQIIQRPWAEVKDGGKKWAANFTTNVLRHRAGASMFQESYK